MTWHAVGVGQSVRVGRPSTRANTTPLLLMKFVPCTTTTLPTDPLEGVIDSNRGELRLDGARVEVVVVLARAGLVEAGLVEVGLVEVGVGALDVVEDADVPGLLTPGGRAMLDVGGEAERLLKVEVMITETAATSTARIPAPTAIRMVDERLVLLPCALDAAPETRGEAPPSELAEAAEPAYSRARRTASANASSSR